MSDEIKTTKCLWKDVTIEEQQCDEFGREGRGTPLVYYNSKHKYNDKKWVSCESEVAFLKDRISAIGIILKNHINDPDEIELLLSGHVIELNNRIKQLEEK